MTEPASLPLEPTSDAMRRLLAEVGEAVIAYVESLPDRPSQGLPGPEDLARVHAAFRGPPPEEGTELEPLLEAFLPDVLSTSFNTAGPGYLAYVPGGGLYTAAVAEFLAGVVNRYAGVWMAAPGAVELETQAIRWLAELMGMPEGTLGVFTTGGSLSTLVALVAAREKHLGDRIADGTLYFSGEVHHCLEKAARIAGIRPDRWRSIPVDEDFRLVPDALRAQIQEDRKQGLEPFFVCASAGTVNTGAIDPLDAVADVCEAEKVWFHIDGAYGAIFKLVETLAPRFVGLERADSVTLDPHKGLFLPYGTGVLLVRNMEDLQNAYSTSAAYMPDFQDGEDRFDFCEVSPELSRGWRGIRVWLPFKLHGVKAFRDALQEKHDLAVLACDMLREEADVEIPASPEISLFAFRQRFDGLTLDEENRRNRDLIDRINRHQRIMITGSEVQGTYYLRICVLHLRTHRERIVEGVEIIRQELAAGR